MKRLFSFIVLALILTALLPFQAAAQENSTPSSEVIEVVSTAEPDIGSPVINEGNDNTLLLVLLGFFGGAFTGAIGAGRIAYVILTSPTLLKIAEGAANNVSPEFASKAIDAAGGLRTSAELIEEVFDGVDSSTKPAAGTTTVTVERAVG